MMKKSSNWIILILAAAFLAACARSTPKPLTYTLEMSEYAFTPSTIKVKAGHPVFIELVNTGTLEHEIMFGRDVMRMDNRPSGYQHDMFAEAGVEPEVMSMAETMEMEGEGEEEHSGFMVVLPKTGDQATLTFTATDDMVGEWEMGCFEQDGVHYDAGMKGKFIVTE